MGINALIPVDVSNMDRGMQAREQSDAWKRQKASRNALSAWGQNQTPENLNALMGADPRTGLQIQQYQNQIEAGNRQQQANTAKLMVDYLERAANSTNPRAAWEQAKQELTTLHGMPAVQLPEWGPGVEALYTKAKEESERYGQPQTVRLPGTETETLAQFGDRGSVRPVEGYAPAKTPKERRIVQGADGRKYYADDGTPVLPNVKTPQQQFMEMIGDDISGGAGGDLGGGSGGDMLQVRGVPEGATVSAGTDSGEPTIKELFWGLPPEVRAGIKSSPNPMKAFSSYLTRAKGLNIQFGADGKVVSISQGGNTPAMQKPTTTDIEGKLLSAREGMARLDSMAAGFKPEYMTFSTQANNAWNAFKEKAGFGLSEADKRELVGYTKFRRDSVDNLNLYIKEITGAQMSESEASRIRKGIPDAEKDSPTEFGAKLNGSIRSLKMATARYVYALRNGLDPADSKVGLNQMSGIVDDRGAQLEEEVRARNPTLSDDEIKRVVKGQLLVEFGLGGQ